MREWAADARRLSETDPKEGEAPMRKALGASESAATSILAFGRAPDGRPLATYQDFDAPAAACVDTFVGALEDFFKAIPPGARWITVRPNGPGTEGHPVLIQPAGDGAYKVIGGADGKLNHLKLTGVRSEADYAQEVRGKQAARREEKKRQRERDAADGLTESKAAAREAVRAQVGQARAGSGAAGA